ncbi:MAG TPA: hypothetical protein VKY85_05645 [Candidatus Angelobacter sp.]|nr:hypothetical protein [Candidatus Angelobacter sp.]
MDSEKGLTIIDLLIGMVLFVLLGVVLLPNFLRYRGTRCVADAAATLRTLNTAEATYSLTYPDVGYATDLATLGPPKGLRSDICTPDSKHACLLDQVLGCPQGTGEEWCVKDGHRYNVQGVKVSATDGRYWITATRLRDEPVKHSWLWIAGTSDQIAISRRNYCSLDDAVVRVGEGPPLALPFRELECAHLAPLEEWDNGK